MYKTSQSKSNMSLKCLKLFMLCRLCFSIDETYFCGQSSEIKTEYEKNFYRQGCIVLKEAYRFNFTKTQSVLHCGQSCDHSCSGFLLLNVKYEKRCAKLFVFDFQELLHLSSKACSSDDIEGKVYVKRYDSPANAPICQPKTLRIPIPGKLQPGKSVVIIGTPLPKVKAVIIRLTVGLSPSSAFALSIGLRFDFHSSTSLSSFNYKKADGKWGTSQYKRKPPFKSNVLFNMTITTESDRFRIDVNNELFQFFVYRLFPLDTVTHVMISEDLRLSALSFSNTWL